MVRGADLGLILNASRLSTERILESDLALNSGVQTPASQLTPDPAFSSLTSCPQHLGSCPCPWFVGSVVWLSAPERQQREDTYFCLLFITETQ